MSGDNQVSANSIGNQVGADLIYGDLLPEDKVNKISDLKDEFKFVAMIGDGVNDAPAMASASLGISMGGIGTSAAIEASDITLMTDDLKQIAVAVNLGKRGSKCYTVQYLFFNFHEIAFFNPHNFRICKLVASYHC